ncbi:MAG: hypothetical protein ACHQF2_11775, partial [Flavobacteriales bacterium]
MLLVGGHFSALAQPVKAWVFFNTKDTVGFRMENYFDATVIERRKLQHLASWDMYDVPVTPAYEKSVSALSDSVLVVSRWFNGMAVWVTPEKLEIIRQFPFVVTTEIINEYPAGGLCEVEGLDMNDLEKSSRNLLSGQTTHLQGQKFKKSKIAGKGIRVAVIDAGFKGLSNSNVLNHV